MKLFHDDSRTGLIIGVAGGLLLQPILTNVLPGVNIPLRVIFLLVCALGSPLGLALLTSMFPARERFFRFALVGALNTAVDLAALNILLLAFGQSKAYLFPLYATIGFLAATLNSFFWNKHWTFEDRPVHGAVPALGFYGVSIIGFLVNVGISTGLVFLGVPPRLTLVLWENIAKAASIVASLTVNYLGYKYLVFRKPTASS